MKCGIWCWNKVSVRLCSLRGARCLMWRRKVAQIPICLTSRTSLPGSCVARLEADGCPAIFCKSWGNGASSCRRSGLLLSELQCLCPFPTLPMATPVLHRHIGVHLLAVLILGGAYVFGQYVNGQDLSKPVISVEGHAKVSAVDRKSTRLNSSH